MNLVLSLEGALLLWQYMLGIVAAAPPKLHLLGSPFTPLHTSTYANYAAAELAVAGYTPVSLAGPGSPWSFVAITQGQEAVNQPPPFNFSAACTVYGWFITDAANSKVLFGGTWTPPYVFGAAGGQLYVALQPQLISVP